MIEPSVEQLLGKHLDGETSEHENQQLEKLLLESAELRTLKADLIAVVNQTRLVPRPSANNLEARITHAVAQRYPHKSKPSAISFEYFSGQKLAASTVLAAMIGTFALLGIDTPGEEEVELIAEEPLQQILGNVIFAQAQYHAAIEELEIMATMRLNELPSDLALVFTENLQILDAAILLYESNLATNQTNVAVYDTLSKIYETKIDLLTTILMV